MWGVERDYLAIEDVVIETGLSAARIRQKVAEGTFPAPRRFGPRAGLWLAVAVDAWRQARRIGSTQQSSLRPDPPASLRNVVDTVVDVPAGVGRSIRVHLRVFEPAAGGSPADRVVVVGELRPVGVSLVNSVERVMTFIDDEFLAGDGVQATWFGVHCDPDGLGFGTFWAQNLVLSRLDGEPYTEPNWIPVRLQEIDRVLGDPLPWFPAAVYTADVVRRSGLARDQIIDVEFDRAGIRPLMTALRFLHENPRGKQHEQAAAILAHVVRAKADAMSSSEWDDGCTPPESASMDEKARWPKRFAARLVPKQLTPEETAILQAHSSAPVPPGAPELQAIGGELHTWLESVDRFSANPDTNAQRQLEYVLEVLEEYAGIPIVRPEPDAVLSFNAEGSWDDQFVSALDEAKQPGERQQNRLRTELNDWRASVDRFGLAPGGCWAAIGTEQDGSTRVAVLWPTHGNTIEQAAALVADGAPGSRPVYVAENEQIVDVLPCPDGFRFGGWNFGYGGSGPYKLAEDIGHHFAQQLHVHSERIPMGWLHDYTSHSGEDTFRLNIADLARRIR